jgi:uncharacterized membrane protein (DUF106 family)
MNRTNLFMVTKPIPLTLPLFISEILPSNQINYINSNSIHIHAKGKINKKMSKKRNKIRKMRKIRNKMRKMRNKKIKIKKRNLF